MASCVHHGQLLINLRLGDLGLFSVEPQAGHDCEGHECSYVVDPSALVLAHRSIGP